MNSCQLDHIVKMLQKRTNQLIILIVATIGIFLVSYKLDYSYTVFNHVQRRLQTLDNIKTPIKEKKNDGSILFKGLLTEDDVRDVPCDDIEKMTSAKNSRIYIFKNEVNLGDEIRLSLTAVDGYGKAKTNGGDQFRAAMSTFAKQAYTNGIVTDYDNGTYGITFEALWTGNATIEVTLAYTKEAFAALYRLRLKKIPLIQAGGKYSRNGVTENVLCDPDPAVLASYHICSYKANEACRTSQETHRQDNCNFTTMNDGFPLFCARPRLKSLRCEHMMFISTLRSIPTANITACEHRATRGYHQRLNKALSVTISPNKNKMNISVITLPQSSCAHYNRTELWSTNKPSGFFFEGRWHLRHCKGVEIKDKHLCLKDRRLYIVGDSTMRQWFVDIKERYNCTQFTEKWTKRTWYKLSSCRNSELNFTVTYAVHGLPFDVGAWINISLHLTSIAQRMDNIPDNENAIFVFHMYLHMRYFPPRYFKLKMEAVRSSAKRLLDRNKYVKIMVKGPHVCYRNDDAFENVYTHILYDVFRNFQDRIIFLNNKDATIAVQETHKHPRDMVVEAMVDQMIVFACKNLT